MSASISIVYVRDNDNEIETVFGASTRSHHIFSFYFILISAMCNGCDVISWLVLTIRIQKGETEATHLVLVCRCIQRYCSVNFITS